MRPQKRRGGDAGIEMQESKENALGRDEDDEGRSDYDGGTFQRASEEVMRTRVIKKARRPGARPQQPMKKNPFASVNLLGGASGTIPTPAAPSTGKPSSFQFMTPNATAFPSSSSFSNGQPKDGQNQITNTPSLFSMSAANDGQKPSPNPPANMFATPSTTNTSPPVAASTSAASSSSLFKLNAGRTAKQTTVEAHSFKNRKPSSGSATKTSKILDEDQYYAKKHALNTAFNCWVQQQAVSSMRKCWTSGLKDYIRQANKIDRQYEASKEPAKPVATIKAKKTGNGLLFGQSRPFPSATSAPGGFAFLNNSAALSSSAAAAPATAAAASDDDGMEKEADVEVIKAAGENELFEVRSKVYALQMQTGEGGQSSWVPRGTGRLALVKYPTSASLVLRTDKTGKILFNSPLYAKMKVTLKEKEKAVDLVGLNYREDPEKQTLVAENDGKPSLFKLKVGTAASAKALHDCITSNIPN